MQSFAATDETHGLSDMPHALACASDEAGELEAAE